MSEPSSFDLQALLKRVEELEAALRETTEHLAAALQLNEYYRQQLHGSKSERYDPAQEHLDLGEDTLGKPEPSGPNGSAPSGPEDEAKKTKAKRTRRTKDQLFPRWLKTIIVEELIPDEVKANPEAYREIETTRGQVYWRVTRIPKFVLKADKLEKPVTSPAPTPSIPGTLCGPHLISQIVCDKFCDHLPHYRQSQRFARRHGIELQRGTINTWTAQLADLLRPVNEAIKAEVLDTDALQIDETPGSYLAPGTGKSQTGYWWAYRNIHTSTVYFDWHTSRAMDCLLDMLGFDEESKTLLFTGHIQCDGYKAYDALVKQFKGIVLAGCMAHLRRKFFDARKQAPDHSIPVLLKIQEIYRVERDLKLSKAPPGCREMIRRSRSLPLLKELKTLIDGIEKIKPLPQSKLGKALTYARNQWSKMEVSILNAELEIDNNRIENAIRPLKLGLKNYLFMGSAEAGKDSALFYTLIENCKVHDLDPEAYLVEVIEALRDPAMLERVAELTPAALVAARNAVGELKTA
ncbi:IS66 family transposase [Verrucomicrobiaceae bacterium 227]